jgi:hypothetical protein
LPTTQINYTKYPTTAADVIFQVGDSIFTLILNEDGTTTYSVKDLLETAEVVDTITVKQLNSLIAILQLAYNQQVSQGE